MRLPLLLLAASLSLFAEAFPGGPAGPAQRDPKHFLTAGFGAAIPQRDLASTYSPSFNLGFSYGYRPVRYLQADAGFETIFGAARVRDFVETSFGFLRVRDFQYFVPLGGRVILPLNRLDIYGGGGAAYMNYREQIQQPFNQIRFTCPTCRRRDGWGYYATVGFDYYFRNNIRIGAGVRAYQGNTEGGSVGDVPFRTSDRWLQTLFTIGYQF